ncbi:MAG: alginate O-acetyltransferase AlgF [Giesbergeria sp.]
MIDLFANMAVLKVARRSVWLCALGASGLLQAQEGALSQLYAARPPAGSSYVRVVNPQAKPLQVRIGKGPVQSVGAKAPASTYAIVRGGENFPVQVGGAEVAKLQVPPDSFHTLVLRGTDKGYEFTSLDDTGDTEDALKAELRFYNLAQGCDQAQLALAPSGTPVFRTVAANTSAVRSVNPVRAAVVGQCGAATTPQQDLPAMQPGDHLSLFLMGSAQSPVLLIQTNRTDPFTR